MYTRWMSAFSLVLFMFCGALFFSSTSHAMDRISGPSYGEAAMPPYDMPPRAMSAMPSSGRGGGFYGDDVSMSLEELYQEGRESFIKGRMTGAEKAFSRLLREYPYYSGTDDVMMYLIYAAYKTENTKLLNKTVDKFLTLYPRHPDAAYVLYMRAMHSFDGIYHVYWDQSVALRAKETFRQLVNLYPYTSYAKDAQWRLRFIQQQLSAEHIYVGTYYYERGNYVAAINRYKVLIQEYPDSVYVPETLYMLVDAYMQLSLDREAHKYLRILSYNYPNSVWYKKAYDMWQGDLKSFAVGLGVGVSLSQLF